MPVRISMSTITLKGRGRLSAGQIREARTLTREDNQWWWWNWLRALSKNPALWLREQWGTVAEGMDSGAGLLGFESQLSYKLPVWTWTWFFTSLVFFGVTSSSVKWHCNSCKPPWVLASFKQVFKVCPALLMLSLVKLSRSLVMAKGLFVSFLTFLRMMALLHVSW